MPLHVSRTCAHHMEVKIALHSLWYHHTYRCDDTRGCVMQFWPPDDEHMYSKHVEAWNKLTVLLHSLWYHHTYRCDDTRGCVRQFWPPDDEHMCSKHVEAWNKLIVKQKFCASSWLITEINSLAHSWVKRDQLDVTCFTISLLNAQHVVVWYPYAGWSTSASACIQIPHHHSHTTK